MAAEAPIIKVIDHCRVSPKNLRPSSPISINLSPFDIPLSFIMSDATNQVKRAIFYQFPNSHNDDFIHKQLLPSLKTSLSLALQEFYPYASKLVFPPFPEIPRILCTDGDSVPFTIVESTMNFGELVGDQIKDAKLFIPLIPKLSPRIKSEIDGTWIVPDLLAIQVTIFPNSGMCIGIHYNHTVGDGMSLSYFLKSWASICRTRPAQLETSLVPFLQRDVVEDDGLQITTMQLWKEWSEAFPRRPNHKSPDLPSNVDVRAATFILSKTKIKQLKDWILSHQQQCPRLSNISSFAAACAFTWVCYVKSKQLHGEELGDIGKLWEICFSADVRTRLKTPTPKTFFGNCIVPCPVHIEENVLLGKHGIVYAANAISDKVKELNDDSGVERAIRTWLSCIKARQFERFLVVSGSPRLTIYDTDFGWGIPKKSPAVHINVAVGIISFAETRDEEGGLEIGVTLQREAMDKFTTLFHSFI